jgi:hypothetical protein
MSGTDQQQETSDAVRSKRRAVRWRAQQEASGTACNGVRGSSQWIGAARTRLRRGRSRPIQLLLQLFDDLDRLVPLGMLGVLAELRVLVHQHRSLGTIAHVCHVLQRALEKRQARHHRVKRGTTELCQHDLHLGGDRIVCLRFGALAVLGKHVGSVIVLMEVGKSACSTRARSRVQQP